MPKKASPEYKALVRIERDLCVLTAQELVAKYGNEKNARGAGFSSLMDRDAETYAKTHNPFWYFTLAVWYDDDYFRPLLYEPRHKDEMAQFLLDLALGKHDTFDGDHIQWPRRAFKSTFLMSFAMWAPLRHKLEDGMDVSVLYVHNAEDEACARLETIKNKARYHQWFRTRFAEFAVPSGEWGTKSDWDWPCKKRDSSAAEHSMRAMSLASKKAGKGYNYRILDDMEEDGARESELVRSTNTRNYDQLRKLKAPPFSREISAGTPYHIHSMYRPMLEEKRADGTARYKSLFTPALDSQNRPNFPTIPDLTVESLARERANEIARTGTDFFWFLQYQLDPRSTGVQTMQWDWIQPLSVKEYQIRCRKGPHFRCVFVDSAWKGEQDKNVRGDDTAIGVIDIFRIGNTMEHALVELVVSRMMTSDEGALEMVRLMKKWSTPYYAIEQAGEKTFTGLMRLVARNQRMSPVSIDLKGWSKKKKDDRIARFAGAARMGWFFRLEGIQHTEKFKLQVEDHPDAVHDDILDMIANSFAPQVLEQYVPITLEPDQEPSTTEPRFMSISRYTPQIAC